MKHKTWLPPILLLVCLAVLILISPDETIDPWGFINPRKALILIFALAFVQVIGAGFMGMFGRRPGAIMSGFFGGLVSSTAVTAQLARRSKSLSYDDLVMESFAFLSATLAMLLEAVALVFVSSGGNEWKLMVIFVGPILATVFIILMWFRRTDHMTTDSKSKIDLNVVDTLKLGIFIFGIIVLSKVSQELFGDSGLIILTLLISLFEIHGSVIANLQLHDASQVSLSLLGNLLTVSILASYVSKIFLVWTLGNKDLRRRILRWSSVLFVSLSISWATFAFFVS